MNNLTATFKNSALRKVLKYAKPYKKLFWLTLITTLALAAITPLRPYLIQYTFDYYIAVPNKEKLLQMTIAMILLLIAESVIQYQYALSANLLGQSAIKDIRYELFEKLIRFKLQYYDKNAIGTLVTRAVSDIETIADIFSQGLLLIAGDLLKIAAILLFMFWADVKLTLVSLATLPILFYATYIFKNAIKSSFQDVRNQVAKLNAFVQEHITGMNIVQIFNREKKEYENFQKINASHRDANNRSVWSYSVFFPVVELLSAISVGLMLWYGADRVLSYEISIGTMIAFILYISNLFRPIRELADKFNTLQMGMVAAERVFKIMNSNEFIVNNGKQELKEGNASIEFKNVIFAYNEPDKVLNDISFSVKPGEKLAIVGATGSGKTSIINVLGRFYEFQSGEILINETPIRHYTLASLRNHIAFVLQDVFLFSDSIFNNITLHNPAIDEQTVIRAAKEVGAHNFIMELPDNYHFNVRERGVMLSVGQRQLIAFIRAYVYNPSLLILDEATSNIDSESETIIQKALLKLTAGRTSIIIAHRLSTIQNADTIMVLDKGKIIETGNHNTLLERNGAYKKLFEMQFANALTH